MQVWGIVVAAGSGVRFGRPKHLVELDGVPLWQRAADALAPVCEGVLVVGDVPEGVPGGPRRRDSVAAGLARVPDGVDAVLVHDAARPLASTVLARRVLGRLATGDADGVIPAVAVRDTLKRIDGGIVVDTVDRTPLVAVQTPQAFRLDALMAAHRASRDDATDDAQLLEWDDRRVVIVDGEPTNLKITYPDDLLVATSLLAKARA
ncbi:MAG: IspD/TarI family cytidylyltransferase [Acidimicrobiia bacterium]